MTFLPFHWTRAIALLLCALAIGLPGGAGAQAFPDKPIRIISPYAPGGGNDVLARAVALRLAPLLGQPVIVENKPGANTLLGASFVAQRPGDSYTLIVLPTTHAYNHAVFDKMPYDAIADFTPIGLVGFVPVLMTAQEGAPFKDIRSLVQYAKTRPANELTYSTAGPGSTGHLAGVLLGQLTGIQLQHVPYKGSAAAAQAVLAKEVMMSFLPPQALMPFVNAGKMVALGVTGDKRTEGAPNVPTVTEQGVQNFDLQFWYGFFGPARLPRDVVAKLNTAINAVVNDKEMKDVFVKLGVDIHTSTPEEFAQVMARDTRRWAPIVRAAGLKP